MFGVRDSIAELMATCRSDSGSSIPDEWYRGVEGFRMIAASCRSCRSTVSEAPFVGNSADICMGCRFRTCFASNGIAGSDSRQLRWGHELIFGTDIKPHILFTIGFFTIHVDLYRKNFVD